MSNKIEIYNQTRRKTLKRQTIGFAVWWGVITLMSMFPEIKQSRGIFIPLLIISLLGCAFWMVHLFRMQRTIKQMKKDPEIVEALNDEFYQHIRLKSFTYTFWVVILVQVLFIIANTFYPVSVESVLYMNILIGVITPVVLFLLFENGEQYDEKQA